MNKISAILALGILGLGLLVAWLLLDSSKTDNSTEPPLPPVTVNEAPTDDTNQPAIDRDERTGPQRNPVASEVASSANPDRRSGAELQLAVEEWRRSKGYYANEDEKAYYESMDLNTLLSVANGQADVRAMYTAGQKTVASSSSLSQTYFAFASALGSTPALISMAELYNSQTVNQDNYFDGSVLPFPPEYGGAMNSLALTLLAEDRGDVDLAAEYFNQRIDVESYPAEVIEAACVGADALRKQLEDLRIQMGQSFFDDSVSPGHPALSSVGAHPIRTQLCSG